MIEIFSLSLTPLCCHAHGGVRGGLPKAGDEQTPAEESFPLMLLLFPLALFVWCPNLSDEGLVVLLFVLVRLWSVSPSLPCWIFQFRYAGPPITFRKQSGVISTLGFCQ